MSKYMQLTVTVRPHYEPDLERTYPHLARHLGRLDKEIGHEQVYAVDRHGPAPL
ncbi:hypothetical protein [Desulforhabdus amnigena]|uniref:Uncharacterized protein n=1 Tax=Desulforhabdus amnigena TaxID=40218 RepID=A0A9W6CZH2_9BACT|nr:hypothetical protein [Desulforhabdus amnigena]GLI34636.1 hypothetical protein DAMNIGENAA_20690 [Desulforhabdus amnigena]